MAAEKMKEILKHFPDLEDGWKEMEERFKKDPAEREMLSLKYQQMLERERLKENLPEPEFTKAQRAESDSKVMKANAPERLYLSETIYSTYLYQVPDPDDETAVECTKIDAFIEKAEEFIYSALNDGIIDTANIEDFMRLFKKYMKGE